MFFTNGGLCSLPRWVGRTYLQLKKSYLQFEKIKTKSYIQLEKIKTKKIEKKAMYRLKNKKLKELKNKK